MQELLSERIITPMPTSLVRAIDDYRFKERIPARAEAIRRLIDLGLKASTPRLESGAREKGKVDS